MDPGLNLISDPTNSIEDLQATEWFNAAVHIILTGKKTELQHRQTVREMKEMAESLDMQAPFSSTIMEVSALLRDNQQDALGGRLWR
ncbi:hypothetical protein EYZ11_013581 [Aspergillus tanneri]|uniref:Uncharacterized protein n=1 Tax=Aspergillus tanneri TaxID=1220188 RepID=A0A4S3IXE2_9EURO|nr:uncharacterized protein ATNIH1004_000887 [Aspergillus tanneri]KAA8651987.1 hypothetical protein ATNIH1004_000887 [Aspergillus tanneri]THC86973.1 hypothetical protein EYZ11_013581 [Aspergillus tanneri]